MSPPREPPPTDFEDPWIGPSTWYNYRCRTCDHVDWVEDIIFDAFPATPPSRGPLLYCPDCGRDHFVWTNPRPQGSLSPTRSLRIFVSCGDHPLYGATTR